MAYLGGTTPTRLVALATSTLLLACGRGELALTGYDSDTSSGTTTTTTTTSDLPTTDAPTTTTTSTSTTSDTTSDSSMPTTGEPTTDTSTSSTATTDTSSTDTSTSSTTDTSTSTTTDTSTSSDTDTTTDTSTSSTTDTSTTDTSTTTDTTANTGECGDGILDPGETCDDANQDDTDACTNACALAVCGDGILQAGVETCDDGNQDDTDACSNTCALAVCGDGIIQAGVEECDDANAIDTDGCTGLCKLAVCGDAVVHEGIELCDEAGDTPTCDSDCTPAICGDALLNLAAGELCDDGNLAEGDGCSSTCQPHKLAFATSLAFNGDLGGLLGADAKCQQLAITAGLSGTYLAWLSDDTGSPSTRFTQSPIPYVRRDGVQIAADWSDLTDGNLTAPLNLSELNATPGSDANTCGNLKGLALTDTATDGTLFDPMGTCQNWTTSAANKFTGGGHFSATNSNWSAYICIYTCNFKKALYCFQQ